MKTNSLLAFVLTLAALLMLIGLVGWIVYNNLSATIYRDPEYCKHFSVDLKPESYSAELEVGYGKLIRVNITNNGFEDTFDIGFKGPDWIATRPLKMDLGQGKSEEIFVYMSPIVGSEGNYTVAVFAKSYCGIEETEIKIKV
ncbi:MAG: hypothetical protein COY38_03300 [Candidatus Aenigmarchaeota archaeon CG_4_10_14_0_8_um_filter_37_24]|nr:hypothetical protein [Candidatus Aenigmarchaeota archaeon]PIV69242.1 MAG: hypothetical protein COS07_01440 [Candidatus Aenigmarchaeota archaeon CG01_land_8_20_14_3_00_37_9]PIW41514.1 MAG: hypothetical protein COW21_01295 [Candidatus Aenigmarchaeota archaeon CG15_BIG_FIL_POST_REV_8_21_14_020_37_27]PIX51058.1 MAG: hypothetical protein COZ52_00635 [Candidatus Aenigmarchaeota archaeon CG_4_8_14_3_um_filter_37_24]PIY35867.1 MAG: hypothetical protein COZ04_02065 [Candidatus Aenigmarchaeota archaeo